MDDGTGEADACGDAGDAARCFGGAADAGVYMCANSVRTVCGQCMYVRMCVSSMYTNSVCVCVCLCV